MRHPQVSPAPTILTPDQTNGSADWAERVTGLANQTFNLFFPDGVAVELDCEFKDSITQCTTDMLSFKGYAHRFLAQTT